MHKYKVHSRGSFSSPKYVYTETPWNGERYMKVIATQVDDSEPLQVHPMFRIEADVYQMIERCE